AVEAMLSHKPVITCTDSGEPSRLIEHGKSGFVTPPQPAAIASALQQLVQNRSLAASLGEEAFRRAPKHSWIDIAERRLAEAKRSSRATSQPHRASGGRTKLLVADNQVLDPPVGGGRIRIHELYRHIAREGFEVAYVGAYDWPGPAYREQRL